MEFKPKSPEQTQKDISDVRKVLDTDFFGGDEELVKAVELSRTDINKFKTAYPGRYKQYIEILRKVAGRRNSNFKVSGVSELTDDDIEELKKEVISLRNYVLMSNNLAKYVETEINFEDILLRKHQIETVQAIKKFVDKGHKMGYIEMPTGSGKTAVFVKTVRALMSNHPKEGEKLKALVLVPTLDLASQTIGKKDKNGESLDSKNIKGFAKFAPDIEKVTEYDTNSHDDSGDVVVMVYDSFYSMVENGKLPKFDIIVFDEAHNVIARENPEIVKSDDDEFEESKKEKVPKKNKSDKKNRPKIAEICPDAVKIAFTATAEYSEDERVFDIFPYLIHEIPLTQCINEGVLANVHGFTVPSGVKIDPKFSAGKKGEYSRDTMNALRKNEERNMKGAQIARQLLEQGRQGVISCLPGDKCAHAVEMAQLISKEEIEETVSENGVPVIKTRKIRAEYIDGKMSQKQRDDIMERYNNGQIDILTFVNLIKEGWDSENAKFMINLRPTRSTVLAKQRLGRILRKNEKGQNAVVVEMVDDFGADLEKQPCTAFDILGKTQYKQGDILYPAKGQQYEPVKLRGVDQEREIFRRLAFIPEEHLDEIRVNEDTNLPTVLKHKDTSRYYINRKCLVQEEGKKLNAFAESLGLNPKKLSAIIDAADKTPLLKPITINGKQEYIPIDREVRAKGGFYYEFDMFARGLFLPLIEKMKTSKGTPAFDRETFCKKTGLSERFFDMMPIPIRKFDYDISAQYKDALATLRRFLDIQSDAKVLNRAA